jgi:26S proteasome regulatory subunit T1
MLKNSFRATVERHTKHHSSNGSLPPVVITIAPPQVYHDSDGTSKSTYLSIRMRDQGGGVPPSNMARIFSYAFTTAGRGAATDNGSHSGDDGGPYAAQHIGGGAAVEGDSGGGNIFDEITGKGLQTGMGTIAGLGYGLPMSRLYAKCVPHLICSSITPEFELSDRYFGGSLDFFSLDGWGKPLGIF